MKKLLSVLLVATSLQVLASEPQCAPTDKIVKILRSDFSETPILKAKTDDGKMLTLWFNPAETSYTVLESNQEGISCIISTGKNLKPYIAEQTVKN